MALDGRTSRRGRGWQQRSACVALAGGADVHTCRGVQLCRVLLHWPVQFALACSARYELLLRPMFSCGL